MDGPRKKGLGRGLGALIPQAALPAVPSIPAPASIDRSMVPISKIVPNRWQPRRDFDPARLAELVSSIREHGVIEPLVLRPYGDGYELVAGERRLRAARAAGLESVPVVVREISDQETLLIALLENLQRADLGPLEEASAFVRLIGEFGLTQEEVARRVGRSRPAVANTIRLLDLPSAVREELQAGRLSAGHARALLALESAESQIELARETVRRGLSVREVESRITSARSGTPPPVAKVDPDIADAERKLSRELATRVKILARGKRGRIVIEFHSLEEFDRIASRLGGPKRL